MDINDILSSLGLDLSDPEVKRGALEAIDAIINSRKPSQPSGGGGGGASNFPGAPEEVEIDPDLILPSQKHQAAPVEDDIEIEDEDHILDQIKQNKSDIDLEANPRSSNDSDDSDNSDDSETGGSSELSNEPKGSTDNAPNDDVEIDSDTEVPSDNPEAKKELGDFDETDNSTNTESTPEDDFENLDDFEDAETTDNSDSEDDSDTENIEDEISVPDEEDSDTQVQNNDEENSEDDSADLDDEIDEDELLDDTLKDLYDDKAIKTKQETRRIKRERTLQAAKQALAAAQAKNASPSLIRNLERATKALEALTEAVKKTLGNVSDEEFNLLINNVLDAIDAIGDSGLSYTSEEERAIQAQEIKNDISSTKTQAELSAEDIAQIRAENQVIKAREQEANKYKTRARGSFKGFQDFINSLYRAIALQVHTEEETDDSWSAISRRHSGSGVLQPGKKIQELPNKKIPIIDFYFDCSGSWTDRDIAVGKQAVSKLADMEADGQIKINIYYFANNVYTEPEPARDEGGTGAWNEIVKNIISTQATNVVIMTDSDMELSWCSWRSNDPNPLSYTVPGYVWYLWRNGDNAPRLPRDLKGRGGTQQFSFSSSDL